MKFAFLVALAFALFPSPASAGTVGMGDSLTDEYQFPIFSPPGGDRRTARSYVELLSELRPGDFDFGDFSTTSRGTPRNQGFEYNRARDGAAT